MMLVMYFLLENQTQLDLEKCSVASWKFGSRIQEGSLNWRGRCGVIYTEVLLKIVRETTSQGFGCRGGGVESIGPLNVRVS